MTHKSPRSPELVALLDDRFKDKKGITERKNEAKSLKHTTPFVRAGFIDKKKLGNDPVGIFDLLGLDNSLKNYTMQG